jgi:hypothetical protein
MAKPKQIYLWLYFKANQQSNLGFVFNFRVDLESIESKPSVQESIGIFQLIDQLETAVDKLLERQVYCACTVQVRVIKTDFDLQYCSKCHTLPTNLTIQEDNIVYVRNIISCSFSFVSAIVCNLKLISL